MRVRSREQLNSRSVFMQRSRWMTVSTQSLTTAMALLALSACGGGGGGGSSNPSPPPPPANVAPTVQAGADQTVEYPAKARLTGTATDDSSTSTLTYTWAATSGPSGVTFGTANAAATDVTFPAAGSYTLTLSVSDGSLTGTDVIAVTVSPATYPTSDAANSDPTNHGWVRVTAATDVGMSQAQLDTAAAYAQSVGGGAGMVIRRGRIVHSWGNIDQRYDLKSTTKSMGGSLALGLAVDNGSIALSDLASTRVANFGINPTVGGAQVTHPEWLPLVTVQQLATHTAGFLKPGGYADLAYQPGSTWFYSDAGLNWLGEVLTQAFNEDLSTALQTRVWSVLGLNSSQGGSGGTAASNVDVQWRDNQFRPNPTPGSGIEKRELASGMYANANAMARVGLLFLRNGVWTNDQRILSQSFVNTVKTPPTAIAAANNIDAANFPGATTNYGVLWWTNTTGLLPNVPRDAYWAWGLGESLIVVIPSLDIVAVRAGEQIQTGTAGRTWNDSEWNGDYAVLAPFIEPIVQAVTP